MTEAVKLVPESDSVSGTPEWVEHESQKLKPHGHWHPQDIGDATYVGICQGTLKTLNVGVIPILLASEKSHFTPRMLVMQIQH